MKMVTPTDAVSQGPNSQVASGKNTSVSFLEKPKKSAKKAKKCVKKQKKKAKKAFLEGKPKKKPRKH